MRKRWATRVSACGLLGPSFYSVLNSSLKTNQVADACLAWTGKGVLVFTSATSVYGDAEFDTVNEDTPTVDLGTEKQQRLLKAEASVIEAGGTVLRLAGLYDRRVGPHNYWLRSPEVRRIWLLANSSTARIRSVFRKELIHVLSLAMEHICLS